MACGCGDEKIYKDEIGSSSNNELTAIVVQGGSPAECSDKHWLTSTLTEERDNLSSNITVLTKHKIQKVSQVLQSRESNQKCYDPQAISIGPYHHGKDLLKPMEKVKKCLTQEFVRNCKATSAELIYVRIKELAENARKCYAEDESTLRFNNKEFARLMFLDGCFLLQFIFYIIEDKREEKLKLNNQQIASIKKDLFLLENQLPFMVLKVLMSFTSFGEAQGLEKIKDFIHHSMVFPLPPKSSNHVNEDDPAHLLELTRGEIIDPNAFDERKAKRENNSTWYSYRSIQELKSGGFIFLPNESEHNLLTDVRFEPGIVISFLRLPVMVIDDSTKSLLLNLVTYEMCSDTPNDFGITSYLCLMDKLIDHADDVKELRQRGILLHALASDEDVAKLLHEIADNLVPNPNAYADVKQKIEEDYQSRVRTYIKEFLGKHSVFLTVIGIYFTVLQTYLTIIQTFDAKKQSH